MKQVSITKAVKIKNQRVKPFDGEKGYLATGGLIGDKIKTEKVTYKNKPSRADLLVVENQLIVARMKETNKVLLIDNNTSDLIVSTGFLVLDVQDGWYSGFLFHYFVSSFFQKQKDKLSIGATQKAINNEKFKKILIPEISFEDQKRIVKILDEADALRQKRKQAIGLLDEYLKSVFLEMFGNPTNNPMRWDVKKIENITSSQKYSIRMGPFGSQLKKHELVNDGIKVIWIEDIVKNKFNWIEKNGKCITPDKYNQLKGFETKEDDILITNMGTIGRTAVVPKNFGKAIISSHLLKITPNTNLVNSIFLSEYIKSDFACNYFDKVAHGQIMKGLNTTKIKNLPIILPDIKLQNRFSDTFKKINEIKQTMIAQSKKLENQFQALMQKALKGEL